MPTTIDSVATAADRRWRRLSAHALAEVAARRAIERAGLAATDVDLLINAGIYHDRNLGEPALASLIQEDIGANPEDPHEGGHGTFSFDLANGSCGMLTGLQVADGFLRAPDADAARPRAAAHVLFLLMPQLVEPADAGKRLAHIVDLVGRHAAASGQQGLAELWQVVAVRRGQPDAGKHDALFVGKGSDHGAPSPG